MATVHPWAPACPARPPLPVGRPWTPQRAGGAADLPRAKAATSVGPGRDASARCPGETATPLAPASRRLERRGSREGWKLVDGVGCGRGRRRPSAARRLPPPTGGRRSSGGVGNRKRDQRRRQPRRRNSVRWCTRARRFQNTCRRAPSRQPLPLPTKPRAAGRSTKDRGAGGHTRRRATRRGARGRRGRLGAQRERRHVTVAGPHEHQRASPHGTGDTPRHRVARVTNRGPRCLERAPDGEGATADNAVASPGVAHAA